jgi:biotin carboxylase
LTVVTAAEDVAEAFETALAAARGQIVLVDKLVAGPELTVNAFSLGGEFHPLTVTDRVVAEPPAFGVALAHVWPSELDAAVVDAAIELARAAAQAVGVQDGPTYTQVLVGQNGPVVGELAARVGGGHDAELCEAALGVDLNDVAIAAALGEEISAEKLRTQSPGGGACIRFLVAPEGSVEAVDGIERAETSDGVAWVRVYRKPGDEIRPLRQGSDRAGAVLSVGESRKQALARARRAARRVRFRVVETRSPVEIA